MTTVIVDNWVGFLKGNDGGWCSQICLFSKSRWLAAHKQSLALHVNYCKKANGLLKWQTRLNGCGFFFWVTVAESLPVHTCLSQNIQKKTNKRQTKSNYMSFNITLSQITDVSSKTSSYRRLQCHDYLPLLALLAVLLIITWVRTSIC